MAAVTYTGQTLVLQWGHAKDEQPPQQQLRTQFHHIHSNNLSNSSVMMRKEEDEEKKTATTMAPQWRRRRRHTWKPGTSDDDSSSSNNNKTKLMTAAVATNAATRRRKSYQIMSLLWNHHTNTTAQENKRSNRMSQRRTSLTNDELLFWKKNHHPSIAVEDSSSSSLSLERKNPKQRHDDNDDNNKRRRRRRLSESIVAKSALLAPQEKSFLEELVESETSTEQCLVNATAVLEQDPLFNDNNNNNKQDEDELMPITISSRPLLNQNKVPSFRNELWTDYTSQMTVIQEEEESLSKSMRESLSKSNQEKHPVVSFFQKLFSGENNNKKKKKHADITASLADNDDDDETTLANSNNNTEEVIPFCVLGTSVHDETASPHVLSPPLMDALRPYMPYAVQQDNYWLKYSLIRDGATLFNLLRCVRTSARTILAIETMDGHVFGSFTSSPWRVYGNQYYGNGEAFLWRMKQSRYTTCATVAEQIALESNVEIFAWTGKNHNVQYLASHDSDLVLGGGPPDDNSGTNNQKENKGWGFALAITSDLSRGTSGYSVTFDNPSLPPGNHKDNNNINTDDVFEIANLEMWTLSPVDDMEQAQKIELGRQFIFDHGHFVIQQ